LSFLFTDRPPTDIHTLSLHDALPISGSVVMANRIMTMLTLMTTAKNATVVIRTKRPVMGRAVELVAAMIEFRRYGRTKWSVADADRKSTRLNSSHVKISYAVFCLKKK